MTQDVPPTPTNSAIIGLASFNRRRAIPLFLVGLVVFAGILAFAVREIFMGEMDHAYGWKLPIIVVGSLAFPPYLVRNLRSCLRGLPMIYIQDDKLIIFNARTYGVALKDIERIDVSPKSNAVRISGTGKPKDIRLFMASDRPEAVVARFREVTTPDADR